MTAGRFCHYAGKASETIPECEGHINHVLRDYWQGEARKKLGPDMWLCEHHGKWLQSVNPFHRIERG